ncbi:MFS transporter-like protein 116 [Elsinoe australis]|uniref:MFS transporter-like protein 116 n=1 Tax=Elsinoe australis TaxID=40998 RepID=A0A4U7AZ72_9PEZI|nr:MFS transporter-like protein 116 [Elsinoe australis]
MAPQPSPSLRSTSTIELSTFTTSQTRLHRPEAAHIVGESHTYPTIIQENDSDEELAAANVQSVTTKGRSAAIIVSIAMVTGVGSMLNGLVTVILPTVDRELMLGPELLIWPIAITPLTCGCTLLLAGSICDAVGSKIMYLGGTILQTVFVLGSGLSQNGFQMVLFRGLAGIAISFCLPSAVSIITSSFVGKQRNMAFAVLGSGQPLGFVVGLVLGGVLTQFVTWRLGFYIGSGIIAANIILILWAVPNIGSGTLTWTEKRKQIISDIDWVGAGLACASLAMTSYVFATITGSTRNIRQPSSIALLAVGMALVPAFVLWVGRQEKLGRPAIIPNSVWKNRYFTTICLAVFFAWGTFNSVETILTFYFQEVQKLSPLETSVRFLPSAVVGFSMNIIAGALVARVSANLMVNVGLFITCVAPLAMTFATPSSSFWTSGFIANVFSAVGVDALFTVANLLITSVFPAKTQALAGGVFNTVGQIGKSVGIALTQVVASSVTARSLYPDKHSPDALMDGYKGAFWFNFGVCALTLALGLFGLRKIGKVGHKRD